VRCGNAQRDSLVLELLAPPGEYGGMIRQLSVRNMVGYRPTRQISWTSDLPFRRYGLCTAARLNKKLCYGRGTAKRAYQYRKKLAIDEWPCHTPKVITVAVIKWLYGIGLSLPVCGLLFQRLYLEPFSRHYRFWSELDCLWLWELHIWQRSLNYKPRVLSNLCVNIL